MELLVVLADHFDAQRICSRRSQRVRLVGADEPVLFPDAASREGGHQVVGDVLVRFGDEAHGIGCNENGTTRLRGDWSPLTSTSSLMSTLSRFSRPGPGVTLSALTRS